jgi:hypothetical protein
MKLDIMSRKKALFAVFEDFCHAPSHPQIGFLRLTFRSQPVVLVRVWIKHDLLTNHI